jgi:hypothetical protein
MKFENNNALNWIKCSDWLIYREWTKVYLDVSIFLYTGVIYNFSKYCPAVNFCSILIIVVLTKAEFILALLYNFNIIL